MLKDVKILHKLPLIMILLALLSCCATAVIVYINTTDNMKHIAQKQLVALLESRKSSLEQYFYTLEKNIAFHAQSPMVVNALTELSFAWNALPQDKLGYLQRHYIHLNPFKLGNKDSYLQAKDQSKYSELHRKYHPNFKSMIDARQYYDFFLIDPLGNIIYSVNKESDFASNLNHGQWKNTHLAALFKQINAAPKLGDLVYADFSHYAPSNNQPASFLGTAIFDENHLYRGVVVYQMPIEPLDSIMQVTAGMGSSGETYLVGQDNLMRSNSRFIQQRSILSTSVNTTTAQQALLGHSGIDIIHDYRNIKVMSAYTAIDFLQTRWAMLVEIDHAEVMVPVYQLNKFLLISAIVVTLIICLLGMLLAADISKPIRAMTVMMNKLSNNDLSLNIAVESRDDEIGEMANALVIFKENATERQQLQSQLRHLVEHDPLTGLYTRQYALDNVSALMTTARDNHQTLVVMFIDIDDFKLVNDTYGHQVGDKVITDVANNLSANVRKDDIVARIGGDEFLVLLPGVDSLQDSQQIAQNILAAIQIMLPIAGDDTKLTLSIGVAEFPDDGNTMSELMSKADQAMYRVKKRGKNSICYWNPQHQPTESS